MHHNGENAASSSGEIFAFFWVKISPLGPNFMKMCVHENIKETMFFWTKCAETCPDIPVKTPEGSATFVCKLFASWNADQKHPSEQVQLYYKLQTDELAAWYEKKGRMAKSEGCCWR
eukprot:2096737-Amphidinium_carterae.1